MAREDAVFISMGRVFHNVGAANEKARSPFCLRLVCGTFKSNWSADLEFSSGVRVFNEVSYVRWCEVVKGFVNKHENFKTNPKFDWQPVEGG